MRKHETPAVLSPLCGEASTVSKYDAAKVASTAIGLACAGLSSYGAFESQYSLEGSMNYLVVAAPLVVAFAAGIPPLAEATWASGARIKASLWWVVLVPAAALAFFSAAERVHLAKAGAQAERQAVRNAAQRAERDLSDAKAAVGRTEADERAARSLKRCGDECRGKWEAATSAARRRVAEAAQALTLVEAEAVQEATQRAPAWLLPACLDLIGFMGVWTGFAGGTGPSKKRSTTAKPAHRAVRSPRPARASNDNDRRLPAA